MSHLKCTHENVRFTPAFIHLQNHIPWLLHGVQIVNDIADLVASSHAALAKFPPQESVTRFHVYALETAIEKLSGVVFMGE